MSKVDTAWGLLQDIAAALPLPASFTAAMAKAKQEYFDSDYLERRTKALKALIAGESPGVTVAQWSPLSIAKQAWLQRVADVALDVAKVHATDQYSAARRKLVVQLGLLVTAIVFASPPASVSSPTGGNGALYCSSRPLRNGPRFAAVHPWSRSAASSSRRT